MEENEINAKSKKEIEIQDVTTNFDILKCPKCGAITLDSYQEVGISCGRCLKNHLKRHNLKRITKEMNDKYLMEVVGSIDYPNIIIYEFYLKNKNGRK